MKTCLICLGIMVMCYAMAEGSMGIGFIGGLILGSSSYVKTNVVEDKNEKIN